MRKFEVFFQDLLNMNAFANQFRNYVLKTIGDSTNTNRVLSVNQLVRFLSNRTGEADRQLAKNIAVVLEILRDRIKNTRSNRTDAIDMTELTNTYRNIVMNRRQLRGEIGRVLDLE